MCLHSAQLIHKQNWRQGAFGLVFCQQMVINGQEGCFDILKVEEASQR
jgi:hypothetical protein